MLDLASLPRSAFTGGLEYNLERLGSVLKVYDHFLRAVRVHLDVDAVWLRRAVRERRLVSEDYEQGLSKYRNSDVIDAFLRQERPEFPRNLLLSPLKVNDRLVGVVGAECHGEPFARGRGRTLNRLAYVLARDLARREDERHARVLDNIKEKVVAELRPRDLAYQILDGLYQLVHFDHSAALLIYERERRVLRVDAEKIAWTKSKSAFIGHEISLPPEVERALAFPAGISTSPSSADSEALFNLLYFHRGDTIPEPTSILCAPLYFDSELLGVLKLAALNRLPFDGRDQEVTERFLPAASVALRNVRERVSLENQALQAEIRAGLVTLARAISHDVNNAMGSLLPLAEQVRDDLREGAADAPTLVQDMDVVIEKAALCKQIFGNMLKLGTDRHGQGPVDVHTTVQEMMPVLESQAQALGVELVLDLGDDVPVIDFSKEHLERILWNLVTNASEAIGDANGTISIRTRSDGDDGVSLTVADDGPGISSEELSKIMQPFYTTKNDGNGLGLSICRALAWQYGGNLRVESKLGAGTRAILTLPLLSADE